MGAITAENGHSALHSALEPRASEDSGDCREGLVMNTVNCFNESPGKCCFSYPPPHSVNPHLEGPEYYQMQISFKKRRWSEGLEGRRDF